MIPPRRTAPSETDTVSGAPRQSDRDNGAGRDGTRGTAAGTTVSVEGTDVCILVHPDEVMLDAIKRNGYTHRHGCTRGGCGLCKVDVIEGSWRLERPVALSVLSDEERANGTTLSCRCVAEGDLIVRLRGQDEIRPVSGLLLYANGGDRPSGSSTRRPASSAPRLQP